LIQIEEIHQEKEELRKRLRDKTEPPVEAQSSDVAGVIACFGIGVGFVDEFKNVSFQRACIVP
jgi:hypothetical protein